MNKKFLIISLFLMLIAALAVYAVTTQNSPTACSGQWGTCTNGFANDANRATFTASNTLNGSGRWNDYGFSIPSSAQIDSVKLRADFFASNVRGFINVRVSGDGGLTYGPGHTVGGNTAEQTFNIDVTTDLSWTPQKLNNTNFRVNVTCFKNPLSSSNPTCNLDWVPVNVTYTLDTSPSANALASPSKGNVPLQVQFNGTFTGGNAPFTYLWDFNDSTTSTQQNPKHNFTSFGIYNVAFTVTDNDSDFSTGFVLVNATAPDLIVDSISFFEFVNNFSETKVNVTTMVKNTGNGNAGDSTTRINYLDGTVDHNAFSVPPGFSMMHSRVYNCTSAHTVNATADVNNVLAESDESNNFLGGAFIDCVIE